MDWLAVKRLKKQLADPVSREKFVAGLRNDATGYLREALGRQLANRRSPRLESLTSEEIWGLMEPPLRSGLKTRFTKRLGTELARALEADLDKLTDQTLAEIRREFVPPRSRGRA